jgi:hypothetical protein
VTYYIDIVGESKGMTKEEYNRKTQDSLHRVDIVDGKWYGYGRAKYYSPEYVDSLSDYRLLSGHGYHEKFDKPWSKLNHFMLNDGLFMKLGEKVFYEYIYWSIAHVLGYTDIFIDEPKFIIMCEGDTITDLLHTPIHAMITKYDDKIVRKNGEQCEHLDSEDIIKISIVDYLVGNDDRFVNCFKNEIGFIALDNDNMGTKNKASYQKDILKDWMGSHKCSSKIRSYLPLMDSNVMDRIKVFVRKYKPCKSQLNYSSILKKILHRYEKLNIWCNGPMFGQLIGQSLHNVRRLHGTRP